MTDPLDYTEAMPETFTPLQAAQVVAHRGDQRRCPENTLLAIGQALALGAMHVELDVQLSADQVPMIYHDESLERVSALPGLIGDYGAADLVGFPAHEPGRFGQQFHHEKIAALSSLIPLAQQHPRATFYVELKEEAVRRHGAERCLAAVHQVLQPILAQCILISFDLPALSQARAHGFTRVGAVTRRWAQRQTEIDALQAEVLFVNKQRIPAGEAISASCPVVVYEIDDWREAQHYLQRGAARIESYAIAELLGKQASD